MSTRTCCARSAPALLLFSFSLFWFAVGTAYANAPDGARRVAQDYLESRWKPLAERDPSVFELDGIDVSTATLGSPFFEYILRGEKVEQYVASSDIDPRKYAALVRYTFPIIVHDDCVGSIIIQRNRDENSRKRIDDSLGEFFLFGVSPRSNHIDQFLRDLRNQSGAGAEISWVLIVGVSASPRFVIDAPGKPLLAGTYGATPTAASLDLAKLKAEVRAGQKVQPEGNEE